MNSLVNRRLIWKECRELTPLMLGCCAAFVLTLAGWIFSWSGEWGDFSIFGPTNQLIPMLNMFVNTCGILIAVSLFVPERENKTAELLSHLPVTGWGIARTKLIFGFLLFLGFGVFCYCLVGIAGFFAGVHSDFWPFLSELFDDLLLSLECFFWGVFWSLSLKRTIYALLLAASTVIVIAGIASLLVPYGVPVNGTANMGWVFRIPVFFVVVFAVLTMAKGWLKDETKLKVRGSIKSSTPVELSVDISPRPRGILTSLLWQSFRQFRMPLIFAIGILTILVCTWIFWQSEPFPGLAVVTAVILFSVPVVFSGFTFTFDQHDKNYRFFQQQSEFARWLWFARLIPPTLLGIACLLFAAFLISPELVNDNWDADLGMFAEYYLQPTEYVIMNLTVVKFGIVVFCALALGQFFSMFVESSLLSVVNCLAFGATLGGWSLLLIYCDASFWIFLFPIGVILLGATWWAAPRWLAEKSSAWDRMFPWIALATAGVGVMAGFMYHRATDVPPIAANAMVQPITYEKIVSDAKVDAPGLPSEMIEPARLLNQAIKGLYTPKLLATAHGRGNEYELSDWSWSYVDLLDRSDDEVLDQFVEKNREALSCIYEAAKYENWHSFYEPDSLHNRGRQNLMLRSLVKADFGYRMRRDDLDAAMKSVLTLYRIDQSIGRMNFGVISLMMEWSGHPNQNSELIKEMLEELSTLSATWSCLDFNDNKKLNVQNECQAAAEGDYLSSLPQIVKRMFWFMPWELERAKRVSFHLIDHTAVWAEDISMLYQDPRASIGAVGWNAVYSSLSIPPVLRQARTSPLISKYVLNAPIWWLQDLQLIRYAQIRLALDAYRLDNGHYPETLNQLTPDYLETLPCDVYSGGDFAYSPTGLSHPVFWSRRPQQNLANVGTNRDWNPVVTPASLIESGPFLFPWPSSGGESLFDCEYVVEDEAGTEIERKQIRCYNYWGNVPIAVSGLDFRLVDPNK